MRGAGEKIRCFIALPLTEELQKEIRPMIEKLAEANQGIKWVKPENLHFTLKFLGDINPDQLGKIEGICRLAASQAQPFRLSLGGLGFFPSQNSPRVVWLGLTEGEKEVKSVAKNIAEGLLPDWPAETRPFEAHLTLGRVKVGSGGSFNLPSQIGGTNLSPMITEKVVMMQSILRPEGPIYRVLKEVAFNKKEVEK